MNTEPWLRWGLGLFWLAIGACAGVRAARGAARGADRGGLLCAALGLAFALAAGLRWHVQLLFLARDVLRSLGLYADRAFVKVGVAALLAGAVVAGARRWGARLRRQPRGLRLAIVAMLGFGVFLIAFTAFLDDLLPAALGRSPGRYLVELGFAAAAALGIASWRQDARTV